LKLSEIKQILAERNLRLSKSLGQNFLHDSNQLRRIVAAAELKASDKVLEIGPGLGPLTEFLLAQAGEVLAIEKDRRLIEFLRQRFARADNLTLHHDDALKFLRRESPDWNNWILVANLPFSVGSPILVELAQADAGPKRMVVTLQWEVAHRLIARSGDAGYGLLTLLVQLRYEPCSCFKIPASCFFPPPDVDSGCVKLVRRPDMQLNQDLQRAFVKVAKRAFSQRRKTMFKLLKEDWPTGPLEGAFDQLRLPLLVRAETVSREQFIRLARTLSAT